MAALRSRRIMNIAVLSTRTGWHTDELQRAIVERGHASLLLPYESLVARLGARDRDAPRLGAGPAGSSRMRRGDRAHHPQRLARADHLPHRRAPLARGFRHCRDESSARDRAYGGQVLHVGAARAGRARHAADGGVRARGEDPPAHPRAGNRAWPRRSKSPARFSAPRCWNPTTAFRAPSRSFSRWTTAICRSTAR